MLQSGSMKHMKQKSQKSVYLSVVIALGSLGSNSPGEGENIILTIAQGTHTYTQIGRAHV